MTEIQIGDKVIYNLKFEAIVRFIGETDSAKGIFYGIELHTPDGRTDGTMNGISYFKCKENYGIFARRSQLCLLNQNDNSSNISIDPKESKFRDKKQSGIPNLKANNCGNSTAQNEMNQIILETETKVDLKPLTHKTSNDFRRNTIALKTTNTENKSSNNYTIKENRRQTIISQQPLHKNTTESERQLDNYSNVKTVSSIKNKKLLNEPEKENQPSNTISLKYSRRNTFASEAVSHENLYTAKPKLEIKKTNAIAVAEKDKEIKDLKEKIETLKILKKKDKDQCVILESLNKELNKELQDVKESKEKTSKEFDDYRNLMTTIEEEFEMLTIDKEMAEEKYNEINQEHLKLKELYDEILKENDILKNNEVCSETKKFFDQTSDINKYKNAVQELYQVNHSLDEINKNKDAELEILRELQVFQEAELEQLKTKSEKYERDLKEMKDLVDSTADVEFILEKLTFDNENLEEELKRQNQKLLELDRIEDRNLELIENKNQEIRNLHEEYECINKQYIQLQNSFYEKQNENVDLNTINLQLTERIKCLTAQIKESEIEIAQQNEIIQRAKESNRRFSIINYTKEKALQDDIKRNTDDKLMKIDLEQKCSQIKLITQYLPTTFSRLGGEYDIINVVLLLSRFINKISLILDYISEKRRFRQGGSMIEKPENISIQYKTEFLLLIWNGLLKQIQINLNYCSTESLHIIGNYHKEFIKHEMSLDSLIDLIKKQCLDHNRNFSNIIQSIKYFQQIYDKIFASKPADCDIKMSEFIKILNKGSECLVNDFTWITKMIGNITINEQLKEFLVKMKTISSDMYSKMKSALIFIRQNQKILFDSTLCQSMDNLAMNMIEIVGPISNFGLQLNDENILPEEAINGIIENFSKFLLPKSQISLVEIISKLSVIEQFSGDIVEKFKSGEYDTYKTIVQPASAIDSNATNYREKCSLLLSLPMEIKSKDEKLALLNIELQKKSSSLADRILQVDYFKKKYEDGIQIRDLKIQKLNDRIIKLEKLEKKTEIEIVFNSTNEISQLETSVKRISDANDSLVCDSTSVPKNYHVQEFDNKNEFITEIRSTINYLNNRLSKSQANKYQKVLQELKPFNIQKSLSNSKVNDQIKKAEILQREIFHGISSIKIPDLSSRNDMEMFSKRNIKLSMLKIKAEDLIKETQDSYLKNNTNFRSLHTSHTNNNVIGRIRFDSSAINRGYDKYVIGYDRSLKKLEEIFCS